MTLAYADTTEDVVAAAVDDPVRALRAADRDGLLRYLGFVSGERYEVEVGGRRMVVPAAEVATTVARVRAVAGLAEDAGLVGLRDDGAYLVQVGGRRVVLLDDSVCDWCAGYAAARDGAGQVHDGVDQIAEIRDLIERPSLNDQLRMVILGLMYQQQVPLDRLTELIGQLPDVDKPPTGKTVIEALKFGAQQYLGSDMAERMIRVFGRRWVATASPGGSVEVEPGQGPLPEMPGVAALRRIVAAARAGWLLYVDEPAPNGARRLRQFRLVIGDGEYVVSTDRVSVWVDGVEAFHAGRG